MLKTLTGYSLAAVLCVGFSGAHADDRVGSPLLRQIGEAVALTKVCPDLEADDGRISELVNQANLDRGSVTKAIDDAVNAIPNGAPGDKAQSPPCSLALARYGPQGGLVTGLVRLTKAAAPGSSPLGVPIRKVKTVKIMLPEYPQ
jgi:hypothetical protein